MHYYQKLQQQMLTLMRTHTQELWLVSLKAHPLWYTFGEPDREELVLLPTQSEVMLWMYHHGNYWKWYKSILFVSDYNYYGRLTVYW